MAIKTSSKPLTTGLTPVATPSSATFAASDEPAPLPRLSKAEFKALARDKGWKFTMLAQRWGVTPAWVSMLCSDEQRDVRYDDALFGLPDLRDAARDQMRRQRRIDLAMERDGARSRRSPARQLPGYRYRGYLSLGSIVTVSASFGSMADEGERGIVFELVDRAREECYAVLFESGAHETFSPAMVDAFLATTGLTAEIDFDTHETKAGKGAEPRVNRMLAHWRAGRLSFWPAPAR